MCIANSASLEVSFSHLSAWDNLLVIWLTDVPRDMLQIFDEVLQQVVLVHYPNYTKVRSRFLIFSEFLKALESKSLRTNKYMIPNSTG